MQIRAKGPRLQIIVSGYCPSLKRSRQKIAATMPRYLLPKEIPGQVERGVDEALQALEVPHKLDSELKALKDWLDEQHRIGAQERRLLALRTIAREMEVAAAALQQETISAEDASRIYDAWLRLRRSLRKAGHRRRAPPKPKRKAPEGA